MVKRIVFCVLLLLHLVVGTSWARQDSVLLVVEKLKNNPDKFKMIRDHIERIKDTYPQKALEYGRGAHQISLSETDPSMKAEGLRLLGYAHSINFYYDSAIIYLKQAYALVSNDPHSNYFILLNLGDAFWYNGEFDSCLYYHQKAEASVQFLNNPMERANITINIADYYRQKGKFLEAQEIYLNAIGFALQDTTGMILAKAYNNMALTYYHLGDFYTELDYYFKAVEAAIPKQQWRKVGLYFCNIAEAYSRLGEFEKALEFANKGINLSKEANQQRALMNCYHMLGVIYLDVDSLDEAKKAFLESIRINETVQDKRFIARNLGNMGQVELKMNNLENALAYYEQALVAQDLINEKKFKINDLLGLARTHFNLGNYQQAERYKDEAQQLSIELSIKTGLAQSYLLTSDLNEKAGQSVEALRFYKKYDSVTNLLTKEDRVRYLANLEKLQESKEKELENLSLKKDMEQQTILIERGKSVLTIGVVVFMVLIVFSVFIFWLLKKNQSAKMLITQQNEALTKKHIEIAAMSEQQENLLHLVVHDLKSPLNKIEGLLSILKMEGEMNAKQMEVVRMLDQIARKGKEFISDLLGASQLEFRSKEPKKEYFDLPELLREVKEEFSAQAAKKGIEIEIDTDHFEQSVHTDKELLYHIVANLLSNAIKFSEFNKRVEIKARCQDQLVTIIIKDQGQGFSEKDKENLFQKFHKLSAQPTAKEGSTGLGLFLTKKLVDALKGQITLNSTERKGSVFTIEFRDFLS